MQHQAGIDLAARQCLQLHVARGLDQFDGHLGRRFAERAHPGRQRAEADGGDEAQPHTPDLAGGRLRLPIGVIEGQVSRPAQEDEPWFPTRRGDWVLLGDGKHGRVTVQTPEIVTVVELGGARRNFRSQDFFSAPPTVLSAGFRLWVPFGVDYRHQALATREIPRQLELRIREALAAGDHLGHLSRLSVEFQGAWASSLDLVALVDLSGAAAPDYQRLVRLVQKTCVETCTENGWGIPFTQLTLHVAREAGAPPGGPA